MIKGQPFMDVEADFIPEESDGTPAYTGEGSLPTFSESFLYPTVGKGDARFILGVGEEYDHIIKALGSTTVQRILDVKPQLAQRLGVSAAIDECLAAAKSRDLEYREKDFPDVTLDNESATLVWKMLHDEYRRYYNPETSMEKKRLRLYHRLTDELGSWEQDERQKEIDRLPEKLEQQAKKRAEREASK